MLTTDVWLSDDKNYIFKVFDQLIEITTAGTLNHEDAANYTLGIRPRSFEVESEKSNNNIAGQIDLIENMGAEI